MNTPTPQQRLEEQIKTLIFAAAEAGMAHPDHMKDYVRDLVMPYVTEALEIADAQTVATLERLKKEHPIRGLVHRDLTSGKCDLCEYIDTEIKRIKEGK